MKRQITALLVHEERDSLSQLSQALHRQGVKTLRARTFQEAHDFLQRDPLPLLVFTDVNLPDGNWRDVIAATSVAAQPVNVIVVGPVVDVHLYVDTIEAGAFDFVTPPFTESALKHVVRCAAEHVLTRRALHAPGERVSVPVVGLSKSHAGEITGPGVARHALHAR